MQAEKKEQGRQGMHTKEGAPRDLSDDTRYKGGGEPNIKEVRVDMIQS